MAYDYAIGDVQGCYDALQRLLDHVHFDERNDRLWFVGDLVNRGPDSLRVLRFIKALPQSPRVVLGNHDLYFLRLLWGDVQVSTDQHTLTTLLHAPDAEELGHWLRQQPLLYDDPTLHVLMCHAGIAPFWDRIEATARAREIESLLQGPDFSVFLKQLFDVTPSEHWSPSLTGIERWRVICNYFTRMRFCNAHGDLVLKHKGSLQQAPKNVFPWYQVPHRIAIDRDIVFGHWSALLGKCPIPHIHALDTGYSWGGALTALRLQDKKRFSIHHDADS